MLSDRCGAQVDEQWADVQADGRLTSAGITLRKGCLDVAVVDLSLSTQMADGGVRFWLAAGLDGDGCRAPRSVGLRLTHHHTES